MAIAITNLAWEDYQKSYQEDIFTLGMIALNYGQLENAFRHIFSAVTGLNASQVAALFERLPNNHRQDVLSELMAQLSLPPGLKADISYFATGFKTCLENRNAIMHAHLGGSVIGAGPKEGIALHKFTKSGKRQTCFPSLTELRAIAESMRGYAVFGVWLTAIISAARHPEIGAPQPEPSLGRPPPPPELSWRSL
jgi:hypothetical protein